MSRRLAAIVFASLLLVSCGSHKAAIDATNANAVPKTADGKPDLSGIWEMKKDRQCPKGGCTDGEITNQFLDIGYGLAGGLPYQPWARELVARRSKDNGKDDPSSHCMPGGLVKLHTNPFRRKFVQTPGLLIILFERDATFRQIYTDGRPLPPEVDLPSFNGMSSGAWDGDTLVVKTIGFKQGETEHDGEWLDRAGSPLTETATITEKFHRVDKGNLEVMLTVDDHKAYTAPWTVKINQVLVTDSPDLIEYNCTENERDIARIK